ncbi:unnamed protein product, partial [Symbiodinium necroappetens]
MDRVDDWGDGFVKDEIRLVRSPCGRLLVAFWRSSGTLAGLYANLTYRHVFQSLLPNCEAWERLAGRPGPDDLDSALGLHGYTLLLTLRGAKAELGRERADSFGSVAVSSSHSVIQTRDPANLPAPAQDAGRASLCRDQRVRERKLRAQVCHFEVLAPHDSGLQPAFSCTRQPGIAFQTAAFRLFLADHVFVDATIFDDHGRVFWAVQGRLVC